MASLNPNSSNTYYDSTTGLYKKSHFLNHDYSNEDAIENVIHYITRTGARADRADELLGWGATGICSYQDIEDVIMIFKNTQALCRPDKEIKSKVVHEIYTFSDYESKVMMFVPNMLIDFVRRVSQLYYDQGHQVVWAVHYGFHNPDSEDGGNYSRSLHIHFVVNVVNFITGNLFRTKRGSKPCSLDGGRTFFSIPYDTKEREATMNDILYSEYLHVPNPYYCENFAEYVGRAYNLYPRNRKYERNDVIVPFTIVNPLGSCINAI